MIARAAFDAFLSYSRKDLRFAVELERALERYTPPREIRAERRPIAVCRDQDDLTGPEYYAAIEDHLTRSKKLVLICSPHSRASEFVNDEIRRFAAIHGSGGIIPVLLSGVPNNAAGAGDADNLAFPEALCELVAMPLAIAYSGFAPDRDRMNKGMFYGSWYTLLANLLDVDRAAIEERDRRRKARVRNTWIGGTSGVIVALSALTLWAVIERNTAIRRGQITLAQRLAAQARVATTLEPDAAERRAILGIEAVRRLDALGEPTSDAAAALRDASAIVARRVVHLGPGQREVLFSGDGVSVFAAAGPNVSVYSLRTGGRSVVFDAPGPVEQLFASADGRLVGAVTADGRLKVWHATDGRPVSPTPAADSLRIVCGALSADGSYLAALATDRAASRGARLLVWRADSARLVTQERLATPNAAAITSAPNSCLQLGSGYLVARFRPDETANTISGAMWQWRPVAAAGPLSFQVRAAGSRPVLRQWPGLSQLAWATDSSSLVLLDTAGAVTTISLGGGSDAVRRANDRIAALSTDGETLVRTRWEEDPYVPLLKSWTLTSIERRSGKEQGVVAETTNELALSPDGGMMVTGGGNRLRLWRTRDGREIMRIGSPISVQRMAVSPGARYVVAFDSTRTADIRDVGHPSELLRVPAGRVAAASSNGRRIAIGTPLGVSVIDDSSGATVASVPLAEGAGLVTLSPDGRYLAAAAGDPRGFNFRPDLLRTVVLDLTGRSDTVFAGGQALSAEFSPDSRSLLLGTMDSVVRLIGLPDRAVRWTKRFDGGRATRFTFSRDGRVAVVSLEPPIRSTATVVVLNTETGAELRRVTDRTSNAASLSPDGTELATASTALVEVMRVSDGAVVTRLRHPPTLETVRAVAFLPGNRVMSVGGSLASTFMGASFFTEQAVMIWNRASGAIARRLPEGVDRAADYSATLAEEDKPYFADVTWSPNGSEVGAVVFPSRLNYWTVPAALVSPELRIWRLDGAVPEEIFRASMGDASRLIGLDDRSGMLFTADAALRAWSYRAGGLVAETCRRVTRALTEKEWHALISPDEVPRPTCPTRAR